jgi:hypothetical protein
MPKTLLQLKFMTFALLLLFIIIFIIAARVIVVVSGIGLQPGTSRVRLSMITLQILIHQILPVALGPSTQPLTEMSTRNIPGFKTRQARKADVTAICQPIVCLENVRSSTITNL